MFIAEHAEEFLDLFVVFVAHLGDAGAEAVTEGVLSDFGFAGVGDGSSGGLGVAAVGFDLGFGGHLDRVLPCGLCWPPMLPL